ncbi:hypothetical protein [Muricauda sp. MAR_2010_75]|uniref:hypothetical protein n=1 Tax=Allomuricauda sp. MAR_2010_75 TaxID=1250232 RepID=UPI0012E0C0D2|nr:hypothetical protein [Muricauda sp. MAR_2010_75]
MNCHLERSREVSLRLNSYGDSALQRNLFDLSVPQTKKAFQKESLSLASINLMLQPDSNHRDWNPTQRNKDMMIFRKK